MKIFFILTLIFPLLALANVIKVGSSPVISSAGIYLAKERGYFKEQGLEVEITDFGNSGAQMTALIAKNELDVGAGNLTSGLFNAILKNQKFKLVADKGHLEVGKEYIALIVRKDHVDSGRYKELKDLKAFKIGLTALDGVSQQIIAERFLTRAGLTAKDVEFVKLSYADMNVTLKSKSIDAAIQLEPYLSKSVIDGVAKITNLATEVHPNQQSAALIYSPMFMEKNKEAAKKFLVAYLKGVRDYNEAFVSKKNTAKAISDLKKYVKIDDDNIWKNMAIIGLNQNGSVDKASLMEDLKWYKEKNYLEKIPNIDDVVDNSFAEEANTLLNKQVKRK